MVNGPSTSESVIEQIRNKRIYMQVAAQLERLIGDGTFAIGTNLPPERDLAQRFGVSRSTVREGVIALEVKGLVDVRVGSGVTVLKVPDEDAPVRLIKNEPRLSPRNLTAETEFPPFEVLQARLLIEPECAALAAENATDFQVARIAQAYKRNVRDNQNGSRNYPGDRLFHIRIADASGNAVYAATVGQLLRRYGNLFQHLQRLYTPSDMHGRSEREHAEVMAAIEDRKPMRARNAMQAHLQAVIAEFSRDL